MHAWRIRNITNNFTFVGIHHHDVGPARYKQAPAGRIDGEIIPATLAPQLHFFNEVISGFAHRAFACAGFLRFKGASSAHDQANSQSRNCCPADQRLTSHAHHNGLQGFYAPAFKHTRSGPAMSIRTHPRTEDEYFARQEEGARMTRRVTEDL